MGGVTSRWLRRKGDGESRGRKTFKRKEMKRVAVLEQRRKRKRRFPYEGKRQRIWGKEKDTDSSVERKTFGGGEEHLVMSTKKFLFLLKKGRRTGRTAG